MSFFAARQPILDTRKDVFGYELLFRDSYRNVYPDICNEAATSRMINGLTVESGIENFAQGNVAFINFTEASLLNRYPFLLPHDKIVVEILETVQPSAEILIVCKELKKAGFILALDDYVDSDEWTPFLAVVDIIKIDYQALSTAEINALFVKLQDFPKLQLLAEKIESNDEFCHAKTLGFTLFQGYFFSKPEIIKSLSLDPSQTTIVQLMQIIHEPEPDIDKIVKIIKHDANLSIKTLRYVQSPIFKRSTTINSINQAIVTLGMDNLKRLISVLFCAQIAGNKPTELSRIAIQRAYFCEHMATILRKNIVNDDAFIIGLLSLIDAMLDGDIKAIIDTLPVNATVKEAFLNKDSWANYMLSLCEAFERGSWDDLFAICDEQQVDFFIAEEIYMRAQDYSTQQIQATQ